MSNLVYGKGEASRSESPIDKKTARIDALIRVLIVVTLIATLAGVAYLSVATYLTSRDAQQTADTVLANQHTLQQQLRLNRHLNERIINLANDIEGCNTPDGKCYQRRLAELAEQTGQTNAVSIVAAYCVDLPGPMTVKQMRDCVAAILDEGQ